MRNIKAVTTAILFFVTISFMSCADDDNIEITIDLIGEWQRSDFNNEFEYKLIFNSDNTGFRTQREGELGTQVTSSIVTFFWNTNGNNLHLDFDGENITTSFSFNNIGQLFLSDFTTLYFNKL